MILTVTKGEILGARLDMLKIRQNIKKNKKIGETSDHNSIQSNPSKDQRLEHALAMKRWFKRHTQIAMEALGGNNLFSDNDMIRCHSRSASAWRSNLGSEEW